MLSFASAPQPADPPAAEKPAPALARFAARLGTLSPADPAAYLALGEEVADQIADASDRRLATTLFVLAFELDRGRARGGGVAGSACLALAELSRGDQRRGWLAAVSRVVDPRRVAPAWMDQSAPTTPESAAYQVAEFVGYVRAGEGGRAQQVLKKPGVREAVQRYDGLLRRLGYSGGASGLEREAEKWPCRECKNDRAVKRLRSDSIDFVLCTNCSGDPGPKLTPIELTALLRFESILLQGAQRSWAAQVASDDVGPLVDPDPATVAAVFEVNPAATVYRDGAWTAP